MTIGTAIAAAFGALAGASVHGLEMSWIERRGYLPLKRLGVMFLPGMSMFGRSTHCFGSNAEGKV